MDFGRPCKRDGGLMPSETTSAFPQRILFVRIIQPAWCRANRVVASLSVPGRGGEQANREAEPAPLRRVFAGGEHWWYEGVVGVIISPDLLWSKADPLPCPGPWPSMAWHGTDRPVCPWRSLLMRLGPDSL